ncbi:MAG: hypothetical protein K6T34_10795 [Thermoflavifilum sp.]|nr:hypothetical protein [Thermoflavifilum sp.]
MGAVHALTHYHWPGNVRQLQNAIEKIVVLADQDRIWEHDLRYVFPYQSVQDEIQDEVDGMVLPYDLKRAIAELEKKYIQHAMKLTGSTRKAARLLNLSQSTVVRRLKEMQSSNQFDTEQLE